MTAQIEAGKIYPMLHLRRGFRHFEVRDTHCDITYPNLKPKYVLRGTIIPGYTDGDGREYKTQVEIYSILDAKTRSTVEKIDLGIDLEQMVN